MRINRVVSGQWSVVSWGTEGSKKHSVSYLLSIACCFLLFLLYQSIALAQAKRVVILKVDGLQPDIVDQFVRERDPQSGRSLLPWTERVFYEWGSRVENFYVRGMSLSAPSWSMLDTGQHLQIKGNVEFDRLTLHAYDYLNFTPFYMRNIAGLSIDMPGTETLDEAGVPLLVDAFAPQERFASFQLYQRGMHWRTFQSAAENRFLKNPRELLDEWTTGFEIRNTFSDQLERDLIARLNNPAYRYLDLYILDFDHAAHHNRDRETHLHVLQSIDAVVGRVWTAIQKSPMAADTALIMVSDHGFNTDRKVYSQGFNLVKLLGSAEGGGHHVITKRRLLMDYAIKGINPFVPLITTTTNDSYYLKGQSTDYPTALVDFDGNERSSIHLRDSDLNLLHILLQQLQRKDIQPEMRRAMADAFFRTLDRRRTEWGEELSELNEELAALRREIEKERQALKALEGKNKQKDDPDSIDPNDVKRLSARHNASVANERKYSEYARTLSNLLALGRDSFSPARVRVDDVIAKGAMGTRNNIYELQNYVVGLAPTGPVLAADGSLDIRKSFRRVDYFKLLHNQVVRNNVQPEVSSHPINFVAVRIPPELIAPLVEKDLRPTSDVVWVYDGSENQALILSREDEAGHLSLRYLPIKNLRGDENGSIRFERQAWRAGLPLKLFEDPELNVPEGARSLWLNEWHPDREWLHATHKTEYSNGIVGLNEQLARHHNEAFDTDVPGLTDDERLLRRFHHRRRELVEADMLVLANNHWNFDVRGFNPGGNHGSFLRISTHSTLMLAGGDRTGIPRGQVIEEPYDSLSFMPTVLAITGQISDGQVPVKVLWERGFRRFPGPVIKEVLSGGGGRKTAPVAEGVVTAP